MSKKTLLVFGYGPGISSAVAERFAREGFAVGLVARNEERLAAGARALRDKGFTVGTYRGDAGDPSAVRAVVEGARKELGPITVLQWNAYAGGAGDVTTASEKELRAILDLPVLGLASAVQEALPDLRKADGPAVLVTNGGFGLFDPNIDAAVVQYSQMGLAIGNAAKHKLVGLLAAKLRPEGIYVGEVVVTATVKGTAFDPGNGTLEPAVVAERFWALYTARDAVTAMCG